MKLRKYRIDLHVHTCLSPCGDAHMTPDRIVDTAVKTGLDAVAITDHNSVENINAVIAAAEGSGLKVLPGMEMTTAEEVHLLGIFDTAEAALELQGRVYSRLPGKNDPEKFGHQWIVDKEGFVDGECERLLIGATEYSVEEAVAIIRAIGGIAIAAHVDREAFSLIGQLGFVPASIDLSAVEVMNRGESADYGDLPVVQSSDAHMLDAIGRRYTTFLASGPTVSEIDCALRGVLGRKVL